MKNKNERPQRPENVIILDKDGRIVDPPWVKAYEMRVKDSKNQALRLWMIAFIMMTVCAIFWGANTVIAKSERNAALDRVETLQEENAELTEQNKALQETIDKLKKEAAEKTAKAEAVTDERENLEAENSDAEKLEAADWISAGIFKVTHYCNCERCQGEYIGATATGTAPKVGRTIAVDPDAIPLGSVVKIGGQEYVAEDTGGAIKGNRIDIFVADHSEAMAKGIKEETVYLKG